MTGAMPSPCIGICKMNPEGSHCLGCARSAEEIADWPNYDGDRKLEVFRDLATRREDLGAGVPVLGHPVAALDRLVLGSLDDRAARWVIGVPGAFAEFNDADGTLVTARLWEYGGEAQGGGGGVRVVLDHSSQKIKMIGEADEAGQVGRIDLCLYTRKAAMSQRKRLTEIGPDTEALRTGDRQGVLFDLGLGLPHIDYCVRVEEDTLLGLMRAHAGESVLEDGSPILKAIAEASPHRVLLTRMGRVEVWSPLAAEETDGVANGPFTRLLPDLLARGQARAPGSRVPATLYPVITLFPGHPTSSVA